MPDFDEKQCAHVSCRCAAEPGSDYCCQACRDAAPDETDCMCGHADCRAEA